MKLTDVFESFLYGKKIRRESWDKSLWIETSNGETVKLYIEKDNDKKLLSVNIKFSIDDLMCEDWELKR